MVSTFQAIILGALQGATEWLPVSSSGHLVLAQQLLQIDVPVFFDVMLHLGTAIIVIWFMRKEITAMAKALLKRQYDSKYGRWLVFIVVGSLITGAIGFFGYNFFSALFTKTGFVATALLATGTLLLVVERFEKTKPLLMKHAVLMGLAQGIAIIPGVSRSGATVGSALLFGVNRQDAAKFSFLLSIPAILGAVIYELLRGSAGELSPPMLIGTFVAMVAGYISIKVFLSAVLRKKMWVFGVYCICISLLISFYKFL